jgi:hypothetical protein
VLVAQDFESDRKIAEQCGIGMNTLERWKRVPEFRERVDELRATFRAEIRAKGIAVVEQRVQAQNERWMKMMAVIEARAVDESMVGAGSGTGLLVRKYKSIGSGESAQLMEEYEVDTGLLRELRELEKHTATELGQWNEKSTVEQTGRIAITSIKAVIPVEEDAAP